MGDNFFKKPELRRIKELLKLSDSGIKLTKPAKELKSLVLQLSNQKGIEALIPLLQLLNNFSNFKKDKLACISEFPIGKSLSKSDFHRLEPVYQSILKNFKRGKYKKGSFTGFYEYSSILSLF